MLRLAVRLATMCILCTAVMYVNVLSVENSVFLLCISLCILLHLPLSVLNKQVTGGIFFQTISSAHLWKFQHLLKLGSQSFYHAAPVLSIPCDILPVQMAH